jgi:dynein heavy chain, axonemal
LYGKLDPDTKTWTDGVIAIIMRECARDSELAERKWIVFDGPVDAVWIENMNTVLDDNKKLCLTSGEIIKMTNWMTMMFEVEDLAQASPATVSRCGMVYLESQQIGWYALVKSYVQKIPNSLEKQRPFLQNKLRWIIDCSLAWCERNGKFPIYKSPMTMVNNLLNIVNTYMGEFSEDGVKVPKDIEEVLANIVLFSCIWSIGGALDEFCRKKYNEFLIRLISAAADVAE